MIARLVSVGLVLGLAALCAVLVAGLADFATAPKPSGAVAADDASSAEAPNLAQFEPPPLDALQDLLSRPLFEPSRRGPVEAQPPPPPEPVVEIVAEPEIEEPDELEAELRGVVSSSNGAFILLQPWSGGQMVRLAVGEDYDGWRLTSLDELGAIFEKDDRETVLSLRYSEETGQ